jgi:hypothetical protein
MPGAIDTGANAPTLLPLDDFASCWFHASMPATRVASGFCRAISRMFPKLYVICWTMLSVRWKGLQGTCFRALQLT